jgi:hypothetical protein
MVEPAFYLEGITRRRKGEQVAFHLAGRQQHVLGLRMRETGNPKAVQHQAFDGDGHGQRQGQVAAARLMRSALGKDVHVRALSKCSNSRFERAQTTCS